MVLQVFAPQRLDCACLTRVCLAVSEKIKTFKSQQQKDGMLMYFYLGLSYIYLLPFPIVDSMFSSVSFAEATLL